MVLPRMPYTCKFGLPYAHIYFWLMQKNIDQSLHTISKNVGLFLTDKTPLNELFNKTVPKEKSDEELYPSLLGNDDF